jgi:hypothetical protein
MNATNDLGQWQLVFSGHLGTKDGKPVNEGAEVRDFRGAWGVVTGGVPPHKDGSTGKIEVDGALYYPTVYGCRWAQVGGAA